MELRKYPEKDLRKKSGLFFNIGLLLSLLLVVSAFEFRATDNTSDLDLMAGTEELEWTPPITKIIPPKPPKKLATFVESVEEIEEDTPIDVVIDMDELGDIEIPEVDIVDHVEEVAPEFHDYVEEMPSFPGGITEFYKFVNKNMKYPRRANNLGIDGKVFVQFVIDKEGNITDVKAIKGVGAGLDEEAVRVLGKSPNWKPGRQGGKRVNVRMVIPIIFKLK